MQPLIVADARDIANRAGGHTPQAFVNRNCAVASDCRNDRRTPQSLTEEPSQPVGIASVVVGKDRTRRSEQREAMHRAEGQELGVDCVHKVSITFGVRTTRKNTITHRNDRLNKLGAPLRLNQRVNRLHRCQCERLSERNHAKLARWIVDRGSRGSNERERRGGWRSCRRIPIIVRLKRAREGGCDAALEVCSFK